MMRLNQTTRKELSAFIAVVLVGAVGLYRPMVIRADCASCYAQAQQMRDQAYNTLAAIMTAANNTLQTQSTNCGITYNTGMTNCSTGYNANQLACGAVAAGIVAAALAAALVAIAACSIFAVLCAAPIWAIFAQASAGAAATLAGCLAGAAIIDSGCETQAMTTLQRCLAIQQNNYDSVVTPAQNAYYAAIAAADALCNGCDPG